MRVAAMRTLHQGASMKKVPSTHRVISSMISGSLSTRLDTVNFQYDLARFLLCLVLTIVIGTGCGLPQLFRSSIPSSASSPIPPRYASASSYFLSVLFPPSS